MIPILLAIDFGGIYHWSQYVASIAILVAAVFAIPGLTDSRASTSVRQHIVLLPLGLLAGWAWIQSITLPAGLTSWLSPGTHEAYSQWLDGLVQVDAASRDFTLSVSPLDTKHVACLLTMLLPLSMASSFVFHSRSRLMMLLSAIAIGGASVAVLGFYRKLDPTADLWMFTSKTTSFAGFVNRNNAALMLNFGLAASLGLLSWRMMALHHIELDDPDFEFNDLFALVSDRESFTGLISGTACVAGLLINGSRGGFVAAMFGIALAFGYVRPRRGLLSLPVILFVLAVSVAILVTPMQLNLESLRRFEFLSADADTLQSDGRLTHWQDGWQAAMAYLPGGAGVSSYGYAYLPYQEKSASAWFEHADNLWLEMLVETGLIGLVVAGWIIVIALIALNRLGLSADPLDQGIRVACWYSLGAVLVSQLFDFGLALPANLFVGVMLLAALVSRDIANGGVAAQRAAHAHHDSSYDHGNHHEWDHEGDSDYDGVEDEPRSSQSESDPPKKIRLKSGTRRWYSAAILGSTAIAIATCLAGWLVLPGLREDALSDSMLTRLKFEYSNWQLNPQSLSSMEDALDERISARPSPLLYARLATVQRDRGRLIETTEWRPNSPEEFVSIYKQANLDSRKLAYPPTNRNRRVRLASHDHYLDAWQSSQASLLSCPLAQQPRGQFVQLDSVVFYPDHGKVAGLVDTQSSTFDAENVAHIAIKHLMTFYAGNPQRLMALAGESLNRGDWSMAEDAFRTALTDSPNMAHTVMQHFKDYPEFDLDKAIPDNSVAMQIAAKSYLNSANPDPRFLRRAMENIRLGENDSLRQRSDIEALLGRMHFFFESPDEAIPHFSRAIQYAPDVAAHRLELIEWLLKFDRKSDAMAQARLGRASLPENSRFQAFIDQIAERDRQKLLHPDEEQPQIKKSNLEALLK